MFSCRDATGLMTEEAEQALPGWRRAKYKIHMAICGHCRAFRRQLRDAVALARELPRDEMPRDAEDRLLEAFRARRSR